MHKVKKIKLIKQIKSIYTREEVKTLLYKAMNSGEFTTQSRKIRWIENNL